MCAATVRPKPDTWSMSRVVLRSREFAVRYRSLARRYPEGVMAAGVAAVVVAFVWFLWRGAAWLDGPGLRGLTPDQRETALNAVRGRLLQIATGLLAIGALVYTALNFRLSREGHVTDRYTKAIEQLGSERLDVRLGAVYALERIMIDSPRDHPTIVEVLAAYVREHAPDAVKHLPDQQPGPSRDPGTPAVARPATDVQAALTVIGRRPLGRDERGRLDFRATNLVGADLESAYLRSADLTGADLTRAALTGADLTGADLTRATLTGAYLIRAHMTHAHLNEAHLAGVYLIGADLVDAHLIGAHLDAADLTGADLTQANLVRAHLGNAQLGDTNLTNAHLDTADLTGADLTGADLTGTNLTRTNLTGVALSKTQRDSAVGVSDIGT